MRGEGLRARVKGRLVFDIDMTHYGRAGLRYEGPAQKKRKHVNIVYSFEKGKKTGPFTGEPEPVYVNGKDIPRFKISNDIVDWKMLGKGPISAILKGIEKKSTMVILKAIKSVTPVGEAESLML